LRISICSSLTCTYVTQDDEKFCMICGHPLITNCRKCNARIISKDQQFCHKCSSRLKDEPVLLSDIYDRFIVTD